MFRKGHKKVGGRRKGTPNKVVVKTQEALWEYIDLLTAQGHEANPLRLLVDLMVQSPEEQVKIKCAIALADRLLPKLKSVELELGEATRQTYIVHLYGDEGQQKRNGSRAHGPGTTPSPFEKERQVYED
jgi:hypothetical protein